MDINIKLFPSSSKFALQEQKNFNKEKTNFNTFYNNNNNNTNNNTNFEDEKNNENEFENKIHYEYKSKPKKEIQMNKTHLGFLRNNYNYNENSYNNYNNDNNIEKFNSYLQENNCNTNINNNNGNNKPMDIGSQNFRDMFISLQRNGNEYKKIFHKFLKNKNQTYIEASENKENKALKKEIVLDEIKNNLNKFKNNTNKNTYLDNNNNYINHTKTAIEQKFQNFEELKNNTYNKPKTSYDTRRPPFNINQKESDIFCVKNDINSLNKIGEKYLFNNNKNNQNSNRREFYSTTTSNSDWYPKNTIISLINYGTTDYDIINSKVKRTFEGNNCIKDFAKVNENNLARKQKTISEICDLNKIAMPNFQKNYSEAIKNNTKIFNKTVNLCSSFNDLFGEYKGRIPKPFKNK
jgi:hypothetical protein